MLNNEGKYVCGMCGRVYDADDFEKAVDHEVERLKGEKQKQFKRFWIPARWNLFTRIRNIRIVMRILKS